MDILSWMQIGEPLLFALLQIGFTVSVIGVILLLLRRILQKRYPARVMCMVWALLAVRLVIPIQFTLPDPPVTVSPHLHYVQWDEPVAQQPLPNTTLLHHTEWMSQQEMQTVQNETAHVVHMSSLLLVVWLIGAFLFLWRELHHYHRYKRHLLCSLTPPSPVLKHIFAQECETVGIKKPVRLVISPAAPCPQLLSAHHPLLVLPHTQFTEQELHFILRHELTHLRHGDLWLKYLLTLAGCLHWFNPILHFLVHTTNEDIELACDSAIVSSLNTDERKQYGYTILNSATKQRIHTTIVSCFTDEKETLMKRFENLFDKHAKKQGLAFTFGVLLLLVGCGSTFAIGNTTQPTEKERMELAAKWGQNTANYAVLLDGDRTLLISEKSSETAPFRTAEELHFIRKNGVWEVNATPIISDGKVHSFEDFRLLYENDLGLPDDAGQPAFDPAHPETMASTFLHLEGGTIELISEQDVTNDGNPDLPDLRYTFADGSVVNLIGWTPQNWSDADGKNNRTPADMAQQFARAISHKSVWYLYPVLSAQGQQALAAYQQDQAGSEPDGVWYSKLGGSSPSYDGYQILPDTDTSCLVVFQMHGGGWNDSRCAYRVTTGTEQGHSVILDITPLNAQTHTNKALFDLFYDSGLPWPSIQEDIQSYNGASMDALTTPDGAAHAIFQFDDPTCTLAGTQVTIQKQDDAQATLLLTFADGSGNVTVSMQRQGAYWLPTAKLSADTE